MRTSISLFLLLLLPLSSQSHLLIFFRLTHGCHTFVRVPSICEMFVLDLRLSPILNFCSFPYHHTIIDSNIITLESLLFQYHLHLHCLLFSIYGLLWGCCRCSLPHPLDRYITTCFDLCLASCGSYFSPLEPPRNVFLLSQSKGPNSSLVRGSSSSGVSLLHPIPSHPTPNAYFLTNLPLPDNETATLKSAPPSRRVDRISTLTRTPLLRQVWSNNGTRTRHRS